MVIYDITKRETFNSLDNWLGQVQSHAGERVPTILVANKTDMESDREVSEESGREWARSRDMAFIETSARGSLNVEDAFRLFARLLIDRHEAKQKS